MDPPTYTQCMKYLLLFHGNVGYANPTFSVCTYIACLVLYIWLLSCVKIDHIGLQLFGTMSLMCPVYSQLK